MYPSIKHLIPLLVLPILPTLHATELCVAGNTLSVSASDYPVLNMINAGSNNPAITGERVPSMDSCKRDYKIMERHLVLRTCLTQSISLEELKIYTLQRSCPIATNNTRKYARLVPFSLERCLNDLANSALYKSALLDCEVDCPKLRLTEQVKVPQWKSKRGKLMAVYHHLTLPSALYYDYNSTRTTDFPNPLLPRYKKICKPIVAMCIILHACYRYCCCLKKKND